MRMIISRRGVGRGLAPLAFVVGLLLCLPLVRPWEAAPSASAAAVAAIHAAPADLGSASAAHPLIGLCEDYPEETRSIEQARKDLEIARLAGARVLRVAFGWDSMEPQPGRYDWSFWDEFVRIATDEYGIRLIPYVCYTPRWAVAGAHENDDFWRRPPDDPAALARFMRALVARYRDRIQSWEIWNEPDNPEYWTGTTAQFAAMLHPASQAVRQTDPQARVVLGGISWNTDFLVRLFEQYHVSRDVDVVNLHCYDETWNPQPLEHLPAYVNSIAELIDRCGGRQQIWLAEIGYSNFRPAGSGKISAYCSARFGYEHTAEYQAQQLFRSLAMLAATGRVPLVAWYRINDLPASTEVIGDVNNRFLGIRDASGGEKPAVAALRQFGQLFSGGVKRFDGRVDVVREAIDSPAAPQSQACCFQRSNGEILAILWLPTHSPSMEAGSDPAGAGDATDLRRERVTLRVPISAGRIQVTDACGRAIAAADCQLRQIDVHLPTQRSNTSARELASVVLKGGQTLVLRMLPAEQWR